MEFSGFFTSCATPAVMRPTAAESLAHLQLRVDAFQGVQISQRHHRAHAVSRSLNFLNAHAHRFRPSTVSTSVSEATSVK